ncbi:Kynureninase [Cladosporium halotolerans]|uniref:Kynureninase n=1 Tax=Cladosporium halotolerans TaxID=1052096 RepID=A0AB34L208_9PEZI
MAQASEDVNFRHMFRIPTKGDLRRKANSRSSNSTKKDDDDEPSTYLCGNSLGLQPTLTQTYMQQYLDTWATKGVFGHFTDISDSELVPWLHVDDDVVPQMAQIVGAKESEVAVMQTLTANLHLMLASFYRPDSLRYKIILEGKAFPSDHYAVESQIKHHSLSPSNAMVLIEPPNPSSSPLLPTDHILATIDAHASSTALLLLPGIQFYTGQLLDIPRITAHAQAHGILVGWDLAHAAGNVPLQLHAWNVDFAVWCSYKYLNSGPGSIGGCFVRDAHFERPRLAGWWGSSKSSRFAMTNAFEPIAGAGGFQLSNPSVADTTALRASLDVFKRTSMGALRERSLRLTGRLEEGLLASRASGCYRIITPRRVEERGAQLSVQLNPGLLDAVLQRLEEEGVVVDERKPDVIRVAPAPLYNTFEDVEAFVRIFGEACLEAVARGEQSGSSVMAEGGKEDKGWSEIK